MRQRKSLLVFFPYTSPYGIHPWIENELIVFKQAGFRPVILNLPQKENFYFSFPKFIRQLITVPYCFYFCSAILIPTSYLMFFPIILAKVFGKKIYISHLSTMGDPSEKIKVAKIVKYLMRLSDRISFNLADYILTFSISIADEICKIQKIKFSSKKFYCSEVIDTNLFKPRIKIKRNLKKSMSLESKFVLFYHGKFHPFHGMEYFFEAFKKLYKLNNKVRLVVLSFPSGMEKVTLGEDISSHPGMIFLPPVKYKKLADILQIADLWVGRFKYDIEGDTAFSTCGVEAMACGKPIITYDNFENTRVIKDGVNGLLVPGEDVSAIVNRIKPLLNENGKKKLEMMGLAARKTVFREFSNKKLLKWIENN